MSEQAEQYSVKWFRWMAVNNPSWLGTQALKLWDHYTTLEARLEAMERLLQTAIRLEPAPLYWPAYPPFGAREEKEEEKEDE